MKWKSIALALAAVLCLGLGSGCGKDSVPDEKSVLNSMIWLDGYDARSAQPWPCGLLPVWKDGKLGAVDPDGKSIIPCEYKDLYVLSDSVFAARANDAWLLFRMDGSALSDELYERIRPAGTITDEAGKVVDWYTDAVKGGEHHILNSKGKEEFPASIPDGKSNETLCFINGWSAAITKENGMSNLLDCKGNWLLDQDVSQLLGDRRGFVVGVPGSAGYVDREGKSALPQEFDSITPGSESIAAVKDGKWKIFSLEGKFLTDLPVTDPNAKVIPLSENRYAIEDVLYDAQGREVKKMPGYIMMEQDGRVIYAGLPGKSGMGIADLDGHEIIPMENHRFINWAWGLFMVRDGDEFAYYGPDGVRRTPVFTETLASPTFDPAGQPVVVVYNGRAGILKAPLTEAELAGRQKKSQK